MPSLSWSNSAPAGLIANCAHAVGRLAVGELYPTDDLRRTLERDRRVYRSSGLHREIEPATGALAVHGEDGEIDEARRDVVSLEHTVRVGLDRGHRGAPH